MPVAVVVMGMSVVVVMTVMAMVVTVMAVVMTVVAVMMVVTITGSGCAGREHSKRQGSDSNQREYEILHCQDSSKINLLRFRGPSDVLRQQQR
jgi:hypothetical protein